ncbi:MAG: pyridoxal-phosphate dependent enzyme [Anaerolineae bacterium]|nr:pyridoxal-phosphate dependent enzyme [Anaerolineae bacterium]
MQLHCLRCRQRSPFDPLRFRCDCGGPLALRGAPAFDPGRVTPGDVTLWRYRHALPLPESAAPVTLGEGGTPLVELTWDGLPLRLKCEFLNPTGSFKDRGTAVLMTALAAAGVGAVVEDSSGNAGASLAAYAARAGIRATVYVPAHASPVKQAQIAAYGASVAAVPGPRIEAARAVLAAAEVGAAYASHVYHPLIHHGMKTIAFELWDVCTPDAVVVPAGHGTLLLGLAEGFEALRAAGCIAQVPRLFGVQAASCAPLVAAWARGAGTVEPVEEGATVAEGVRIAVPLRGPEVLAAVRESGGALVAVADEATLAAQRKLAHQGLYVEPTSAVALAALDHLRDRLGGTTVVVLTGSGFKSAALHGA